MASDFDAALEEWLQRNPFDEDDEQQRAYEDNLIDSTRKWLARRIKETLRRDRTLVIPFADWNEHLREDSGGAINATALHLSPLFFRMKASLIATGTIKDMTYDDAKDYSLTVVY